MNDREFILKQLKMLKLLETVLETNIKRLDKDMFHAMTQQKETQERIAGLMEKLKNDSK